MSVGFFGLTVEPQEFAVYKAMAAQDKPSLLVLLSVGDIKCLLLRAFLIAYDVAERSVRPTVHDERQRSDGAVVTR